MQYVYTRRMAKIMALMGVPAFMYNSAHGMKDSLGNKLAEEWISVSMEAICTDLDDVIEGKGEDAPLAQMLVNGLRTCQATIHGVNKIVLDDQKPEKPAPGKAPEPEVKAEAEPATEDAPAPDTPTEPVAV